MFERVANFDCYNQLIQYLVIIRKEKANKRSGCKVSQFA